MVKATLSATERARLVRSINPQLELVEEGSRRGVKVVWARRGRSGLTLWDGTGTWTGMPERVEREVYGGLSEADQDRIEAETPTVFASPDLAIAWGFEQGAFQALPHARNAYDKLKRGKQPKDAQEMARLWVSDVQRWLDEAA